MVISKLHLKKKNTRETRETSEDNRNRCVKMNNAAIQPLVRCGASEELLLEKSPSPSVPQEKMSNLGEETWGIGPPKNIQCEK